MGETRSANREHVPDSSRLPSCVTGWKPSGILDEFYDGSQLLVAVPIRGNAGKWYYELSVVSVSCDSEYFNVQLSNGEDWGWELSDCDFYVELQR